MLCYFYFWIYCLKLQIIYLTNFIAHSSFNTLQIVLTPENHYFVQSEFIIFKLESINPQFSPFIFKSVTSLEPYCLIYCYSVAFLYCPVEAVKLLNPVLWPKYAPAPATAQNESWFIGGIIFFSYQLGLLFLISFTTHYTQTEVSNYSSYRLWISQEVSFSNFTHLNHIIWRAMALVSLFLFFPPPPTFTIISVAHYGKD